MQRVSLTYSYGTKDVSNRNKKKLLCLLMESGCETSTLDSFAYTWGAPEYCVMTKMVTKDAKMLHRLLTRYRKENQFFFLSEFNDTGKEMTTKLKIFPERYELCGKPASLYKTKFESLFLNYQGVVAMPCGDLRAKEHSSNEIRFSVDNTSQVSFTSLSFSEVNSKRFGAQPERSVGADKIN